MGYCCRRGWCPSPVYRLSSDFSHHFLYANFTSFIFAPIIFLHRIFCYILVFHRASVIILVTWKKVDEFVCVGNASFDKNLDYNVNYLVSDGVTFMNFRSPSSFEPFLIKSATLIKSIAVG